MVPETVTHDTNRSAICFSGRERDVAVDYSLEELSLYYTWMRKQVKGHDPVDTVR